MVGEDVSKIHAWLRSNMRPLTSDGIRLRVLSLGAGVQSSALAMMAGHGEIPMPDVAIFADTGDEKRGTYRYLEMLDCIVPFPILTVRRFKDQSLSEHTLHKYRGNSRTKPFSPPFFVDGGMLPKQCSKEFKTRAIVAGIRGILGLEPRERGPNVPAVEVWLGISKDEAHRMKPSEVPWIRNSWPLIDRNMRRYDCIRWLEDRGWPLPPRSACVYCPYQSDREWDDMKQNTEDDDFARAVAFDEAIRDGGNGTTGPLYVTDRRRPLAEIEFDRQRTFDFFGNDCEGQCGV